MACLLLFIICTKLTGRYQASVLLTNLPSPGNCHHKELPCLSRDPQLNLLVRLKALWQDILSPLCQWYQPGTVSADSLPCASTQE